MSDLVSPFVGKPLDLAESTALAAVMKAIAEPARLQLLSLLHAELAAGGGELAAYELRKALDGRVTQPTISHHLGMLGAAGLVTSRREGRYVQYRVVPARLAEVAALLHPGRPR